MVLVYIIYIEYIYIYVLQIRDIEREREICDKKDLLQLEVWIGFPIFLRGILFSHLAFFFKNSSSKKSTPSQSILCFGGSQSHIASPSLIVLPFFGRSACWVLPTEVLHTLNTHGASRFSFTGLQAIRDQLATSQVWRCWQRSLWRLYTGGKTLRLPPPKKKKQARKTPTKAPKSVLSQGF